MISRTWSWAFRCGWCATSPSPPPFCPPPPPPTSTLSLPDEDSPPLKWEDTVEFTFPVTHGTVIKVYDADTITIAAKLPYPDSPWYRLPVRLRGIDAPEIKGKDISDEEKACAIIARNYLSNLVLHQKVRLEKVGNEKYGRLLADVYLGNKHLNALLLEERYVVPYDGGTKQKPASWTKYRVTGEFL